MKNSIRHYQFISNFEKLKNNPAFLISGNDLFQKDRVLEMILNEYFEDRTDNFDLITFYGDDFDLLSKKPIDVIENLESPPFLSPKKIVVLKNFDPMSAGNKMMIAEYLQNPVKSSILIMLAEKLDKRLKASKIIADIALTILCYPPYNESDIAKWLRAESRKRNIRIEQNAIDLFAQSIDLDYMIANNELEKLIIYNKKVGTISKDDVSAMIGKSRKSKIFDLQNSLGDKKLADALKITENLIAQTSEKVGIFVVIMLLRYFLILWKINSLRNSNLSDTEISNRHLKKIYYKFRTDYLNRAGNFTQTEFKKIFSLLLATDYELKSVNLDEKLLLETMIIKICR